MKRTLNVSNVIILSLVLILSSCNKAEEEGVLYSVGDTYVLKRMLNDEIIYGTVYYLYANKSLSKVTVTKPGGSEIDLSVFSFGANTFYFEPDSADYVTTTPMEDDYKFNVIAQNGETMQVNDYLEFDDMDIPVITETIFNLENETCKIVWNTVPGSDGFILRQFDTEGEMLFSSPLVASDKTEYDISFGAGTWYKFPSSGTSYTVQIQSFSYEKDTPEVDKAYNLKEITIGEKEFVWGE